MPARRILTTAKWEVIPADSLELAEVTAAFIQLVSPQYHNSGKAAGIRVNASTVVFEIVVTITRRFE